MLSRFTDAHMRPHGTANYLEIYFVHNIRVKSLWNFATIYRRVSNISRTLEDNKIVDHWGIVGASPVGVAPTTYSFSGFIGLGKVNCMMRRES